jgi:tetratricopeptide (TPR) repeat protein
MEGLKSLIKVLRPSEKRLLTHYYSRTTNAEDKLRLRLFKLVEGGVNSDADAKAMLNSTGGGSAYSHLKSRLKDDILNVLLTQDTNKRLAQHNRAAELDCRKKVAQSYLLLLRGAQTEGMKVLEKALRTADQYELLAERLQINHLLREKFLGSGSSEELTRLNTEIAKDLDQYSALLYVEEQSFILSSPDFNKNLKTRSNEAKNLQLIEELGKLFKKHKLARIGFWYYMAATEYSTARKDFREVVNYGVKFLKLVEKNPSVRSKNNMAGVNQTLGSGYLELKQFEEARKHLSKSEKLFPAAGFNRLQCLQLLVQSEAAMSDHESALKNIGIALAHPRIMVREHLNPRWLFIKSGIEFLSGDFQQSFKTLNRDGFLIKQQDEWNVQFRLLEMMLLVELKDEEWLEFKLDATRKFLTRHKELDNPRVRLAIDILGILVRKRLDFSELPTKHLESLQLSLSGADGYEWSATGPEIVRFDTWANSKIPQRLLE